jgi:hypothetical protein
MKSRCPAIFSFLFLVICLLSGSFVKADPTSDANKARYFYREEKTSYDRVMSKYVSSFLIVGFVIVFFLLIVVFVGGVEGGIKTSSNVFLGFYVFLLINYAFWLFVHNSFVLILILAVTGGFFLFIPAAFLKERLEEKIIKQKDLKLQWTCSQCGVVNQHSSKCWNCGQDKQ